MLLPRTVSVEPTDTDDDDTLGVPTITKHFRIHECRTISLEGLLTRDQRLLYRHQGTAPESGLASPGREGPMSFYHILPVLFEIVHCP